MRKKKGNGKLFLGLLVAVITLGVGYAAITGIGSYACSEFTTDDLTFTISKLNLSTNSNVVIEVDPVTYSGHFLDPSAGGDTVELRNEIVKSGGYAVYYVDTANGIKNKLQEGDTGDWKLSGWNNDTDAGTGTITIIPISHTILFIGSSIGIHIIFLA